MLETPKGLAEGKLADDIGGHEHGPLVDVHKAVGLDVFVDPLHGQIGTLADNGLHSLEGGLR